MKPQKVKKQLFSVLLDAIDSKRLEDIAAAKQMTKSQAFREWLKNATRALEASQNRDAA